MGQRPRSSRRQDRSALRRHREVEVHRRRMRGRLVWAAVGLVAVAAIVVAVLSNRSGSASAAPTIDGVQCSANEQVAYHIHAHVAIFDQGRPVTIPSGSGIDQAHSCLYWLHTHDATNEIHIESPSQAQYTLGTFIDIWHQSLTPDIFLSHKVSSGHSVRAYTGSTLVAGNPRNIQLTEHERITVEYGPPWVAPETSFAFPNGD